jgi:polysaccharide biosynthesis/export protein
MYLIVCNFSKVEESVKGSWESMLSGKNLRLFLVALCVSAHFFTAANAFAQAAPATTPSQPAPAAGEAPPKEDENAIKYIIGPGDTLQVFVWRNPELSATASVRPDGKISTPLAEDIVAVGKTPFQLARDMEKVLSNYVRSPTVNIIVTTAVSTFSQVKVVGQVARPSAIAYREGMTVMDVVLAVGGLSEFAAGNRAKIVRPGDDGRQQEIRVKLADLLNKGDMKQNLPMQPGDVLVVPQSRF